LVATALVAGLLGLALGGAVAWRVLGARAKARHTRLVAAAREQVAASTQNMRAVNARLQAELEKERTASQQRQAAFAAEQRSSVTRLEGQLRFAYAEIDRLNAAARAPGGAADDGVTDGQGFALTRPFER
jgi:small-conductance mechanosensitive channel